MPPIDRSPCRNQEPVLALSVRPPISVPDRLTVDPDRLNVPKSPCVNVPLRSTDEFVAVIVLPLASDPPSRSALWSPKLFPWFG